MKHKILIADENAKELKLFCELMESEEYQILTTISNTAAFELISIHKPILVLYGIGVDIQKIKELFNYISFDNSLKSTKIIFLTEYENLYYDDYKEIIVAVIKKPYNILDLKLRIKEFLKTQPINQNSQHLEIETINDSIFTDIKFSKALFQSEDKLKFIFSFAKTGIALFDKFQYFKLVNPFFCKITGFETLELLNSFLGEIVHPEYKNADKKFIEKLINNEIDSYTLTRKFIKKNKEVVWLKETYSVVKDEFGNIEHFIGIFDDVSGEKEKEFQDNEIRKKLEFLSQSASILLTFEEVNVIYEFLGMVLEKIIKDNFIFICEINEQKKTATLKKISGFSSAQLIELICICDDIENKTFELQVNNLEIFKSGKLHQMPDVVNQLNFINISQKQAIAVQRVFGIKRIYTIGISRNEKLYATITFLQPEAHSFADADMIETLVYQAATAFCRIELDKKYFDANQCTEMEYKSKCEYFKQSNFRLKELTNAVVNISNEISKSITNNELIEKVNQMKASSDLIIDFVENTLNKLENIDDKK